VWDVEAGLISDLTKVLIIFILEGGWWKKSRAGSTADSQPEATSPRSFPQNILLIRKPFMNLALPN
jgi:hypothetical protein